MNVSSHQEEDDEDEESEEELKAEEEEEPACYSLAQVPVPVPVAGGRSLGSEAAAEADGPGVSGRLFYSFKNITRQSGGGHLHPADDLDLDGSDFTLSLLVHGPPDPVPASGNLGLSLVDKDLDWCGGSEGLRSHFEFPDYCDWSDLVFSY